MNTNYQNSGFPTELRCFFENTTRLGCMTSVMF